MASSSPEGQLKSARRIDVPVSADPRVIKLQKVLGDALAAPMTAVPKTVEDPQNFESILTYVSAGGRIPGIDYNQLGEAEREAAFAAARKILNTPVYSVVGGDEWSGEVNEGEAYHHPNPNDPDEKFGAIYPLRADAVERVMRCVEQCRIQELPHWDGAENQGSRIATLDRVAARMMKENATFGALLALSGGKAGIESFRDSQEFYDFANNYRNYPQALALQQILLRSGGDTQLGVRPFDKAVGIWQPFNFPCIGFGDVFSALMAGNTAVVHTTARAVGVYKWFHQLCLEEGVPVERLHFVVPDGDSEDETQVDPAMSKALAEDPRLGNIFFTGSLGVATQLAATQQRKSAAQGRLDLKLHAEAGGYNTMTFVGLPENALEPFAQGVPASEEEWDAFLETLPADSFLASFREALEDSACGLQGHKCSALSEIIFAQDEYGESGLSQSQIQVLTAFVVAVMNRVKVADVTKDPTARMGALIDGAMKKRVAQQMEAILSRNGARILTGNGTLEDRMNVPGLVNAIKPIVYVDPEREQGKDPEIFAPAFRIHTVAGGATGALERLHEIPYALTGAVYARTTEEARTFRQKMPSGVAYPNGGAYAPTTTAAPAPQVPFGGIKGSGTQTGLLRPGTALHPLLFADVFSEVNLPRAEWGQGKGPDQAAEALEAFLRIQGVQTATRKAVAGAAKL